MNTLLQCAARTLDLSAPVVMGVLNVTPDSFSDGGRFLETDVMLRRVADMLADGASIIDVGGESTRPGAEPVSTQQELDRVIPAIEAIHSEFDTIISLDTSTAEVIRAGAAAGAGFINDVRALRREGALRAAADTGLPVCLMHMQGEPANMQSKPVYDDVVIQVQAFFIERIAACQEAGVDPRRMVLDPGFGFGKTDAQNVELLAALPSMMTLGLPLLVGLSRKSMIGRLLDREVDDRVVGSVALALMAMERGASIVRVHDVAQTMDALRLFCAVKKAAST